MKNSRLFLILFVIILLPLLFIYFNSKRISKLNEEYRKPIITDSFNGVITSVFAEKGGSFIIVDSVQKYLLIQSRNENYSGKNIYLDKMLLVGDTIVKNVGTDSLFIKREGKEYYFIIGKFIKP